MRRLRARLNGRLVLATTAIGISLLWSHSLGAGTPDQSGGPMPLPEPATIGLFLGGVAAMIAVNWYRRRK